MAWHPEQYVLGNYFQTEINELFRKSFPVKPFGNILDIGCGDGEYSNLLASHIKKGQILGIDSSEDMIHHARHHWSRTNLSFSVQPIEEFHQSLMFDFALSFWCLHWTQIELSFPNIFHALKFGGRMYAVFSSFSDHSILQVWHELTKQGRYKELATEYIDKNDPYINYFYRVVTVLNQIPFKKVKLDLKTIKVLLPHVDYFKGLILTLPFMTKMQSDSKSELLEAMVEAFYTICKRKHNGELYYETRPIFLEAIK